MTNQKDEEKLRLAEWELDLVLVALNRAEDSLINQLGHINRIPHGDSGPALQEWSRKYRELKLLSELDVHALVVSLYQMLEYTDRIKELKAVVTNELREAIEIMRHHYEHWSGLKHYYQSKEGSIPTTPTGNSRNSSTALKYYTRFRGAEKNSPKGSLSFSYVPGSNGNLDDIRIGGALSVKELRNVILKMSNLTTKSLSAYHNVQ